LDIRCGTAGRFCCDSFQYDGLPCNKHTPDFAASEAELRSNLSSIKETVGTIIGFIIIIIAVGSLIYDKFFYKPEINIPTAQQEKELEQKLINRYGSLDNIPTNERDCLDYGEGKGCW